MGWRSRDQSSTRDAEKLTRFETISAVMRVERDGLSKKKQRCEILAVSVNAFESDVAIE
jgi:hypothetical protein